MQYAVPGLSIVFMMVAALMGIAIPVVLLLFFRKKYKADILPFFIGCAVFAVFALILEGIVHALVLKSAVGTTLQSNSWLFALYGGLMAGIFEETGRFTAFKTILRKKRGKDVNGLMYGAGHGGFEAFYILVASMVSYIVMALMINAGMADKLIAGITDPKTLQTMKDTFASLSSTAPATYLVGVVERLAAVVLHISLSVLVWFAAKESKRLWLYPAAVLLHALVDFVAVILAKNGLNVWVIEGLVYLMSAACAVIAVCTWKKYAVAEDVSSGTEIAPDQE